MIEGTLICNYFDNWYIGSIIFQTKIPYIIVNSISFLCVWSNDINDMTFFMILIKKENTTQKTNKCRACLLQECPLQESDLFNMYIIMLYYESFVLLLLLNWLKAKLDWNNMLLIIFIIQIYLDWVGMDIISLK